MGQGMGLGNGHKQGPTTAAGNSAREQQVPFPNSSYLTTPTAMAAPCGSSCGSSSGGSAKRSRLEMESGTCGIGSTDDTSAALKVDAVDAYAAAVEEKGEDEPWLNAPRREKGFIGTRRNRGRSAKRSMRINREPPPGGGGGGGGIDSEAGGEAAPVAVSDGIDTEGRSQIWEGRPSTGNMVRAFRLPHGTGGGGGSGRSRRHDEGGSGRSRRRGNGPLGKVVGVPRQAKAQDVRIVYDACAFIKGLEVRAVLFICDGNLEYSPEFQYVGPSNKVLIHLYSFDCYSPQS